MKKQIKIISSSLLNVVEKKTNEFLDGFQKEAIVDTEFYCVKYKEVLYFYTKITFLKSE